MINLQKNTDTIGQQAYPLVEKTGTGEYMYDPSPWPVDGVFLLDENANALDK